MMKNNHHNLNCSFEEEIVAYIYGEIEPSKKLAFERHLANCSSCAAETAEFANVSFSIGAWRDAEFAQLSVPQITIPYVETQENNEITQVSLLENLRRMFSFSPLRLTVAAAFLVVCAGLVFVTVKFNSSTDVAGINNSNNVKPAPLPTATVVSANANPEIVQNASEQSNDSTKKPLKNDETKEPLKTSDNAIKVSDTPKSKIVRQNAEVITPNKTPNKINVKNDVKAVQNKKAPSLNNFEEEEDDSLRLADLFAEIETER